MLEKHDPETEPQIIAIAGYGRSGSTLLESLISQSHGGIAIGEVKYLWSRGLIRNELCSCGTPTKLCSFWQAVLKRAFPEGLDVQATETLRRKVERHRIFFFARILGLQRSNYKANRSKYVKILRQLYLAIGEEAKTKLVIDSSKDPAHIDLLAEAFSDLKVIHLVRDSRAVAYSFSKPKIRPEVHWTTEYMGTRSTVRASIEWAFINWSIDRLFHRHGQVQRLRYEDLATDKVRSETPLSALNIFKAKESLAHSVSGNPIRFDAQERRVTLDQRWLKDMTGNRRRVVSVITFPLLWRYGYLGS